MLILYNKPYQVLSQFNLNPDYPEKRSLAGVGLPEGVSPLGRLDYDSEGLLLLSDEVKDEKAFLDPVNNHKRTYLVQVEGTPSVADLEKMRQGELEIRVNKSIHLCRPAEVALLEKSPEWLWERNPAVDPISQKRSAWLRLTLTEGKNRQIRRMTAKIGCPTLRLVRERIGDFTVQDLPSGEWVLTSTSS